MWFDTWFDVLRVLLVGVSSYVALLIAVRIAGKRSLSQLSAFDFVVTVSRRLHRLVTAEPSLLVWQGTIDESALRRHRLAHGDIEQAIRQSGYGDLKEVGAVLLEANGRFSVIGKSTLGDGSALP